MLEALMIPTDRVRNRIQKAAIRAFRDNSRFDEQFIDVEERFLSLSSALTRLHAHEVFKGLTTFLNELIQASNQFIATKGARNHFASDQAWRSFLKCHKQLEKAAHDFGTQRFTRADIDAYLDIIGYWRDMLMDEGYDPSGIVRPEILVLAGLMTANFAAYEETLNADL